MFGESATWGAPMMPPLAARFDASWLGFGIVLGSLAGRNGAREPCDR